jgi:hypothetical protein
MEYEGGIDDPIDEGNENDGRDDEDDDDEAENNDDGDAASPEEAQTSIDKVARKVARGDYEMDVLVGGKELSKADELEMKPTNSDGGNFNKWFRRVSAYLADKGYRLNRALSERFFKEKIKYERLSNADAEGKARDDDVLGGGGAAPGDDDWGGAGNDGEEVPLQPRVREESDEYMNKTIRGGAGETREMGVFEDGKTISNSEVREMTPAPGERSDFNKWFNRVAKYLNNKGLKFKAGMSKLFFEGRTGYQMIGDDGFETEGQARQEHQDMVEDERRQEVREREENINKAYEKLRANFPNMKEGNTPFLVRLDDFERVMLKLTNKNSKEWDVNDHEKKGFPKKIKDFLGEEAKNIANNIEDVVTEKEKEKVGLEETVNNDNEDAETRDNAKKKVIRIDEDIDKLKIERDEALSKTSTRYKVRRIFEKYGFTVAAIVSSIGIIIGAIVSNLKSGLGKVAEGMGKGLKEIGKELGKILPGMVGAIASFIFKTAGEALGFLAKNAWLLIVAVVLYAVDQMKVNRGKGGRRR